MNFEDVYGKKTLIFDGAMGTMLQSRNLAASGCPDLVSLTDPASVTAIHAQYAAAGANIITTNTFGANICKLSSYNLSDKMWDINIAAAKAARAVGPGILVAGDLGPSGSILEPYGSLSPLDAYDAYFKQSLALTEGGVDLLIIETMSDLREARIAYMAAREATRLPIIVSLTYNKMRTLMGNPPSVVAATLTAIKADGVGANCSGGPKEIFSIIQEYARYTSLPLTAQPNAGLPVLVNGVTTYPLNSEAFFKAMFPLADSCACIGGCCGTTPKHIKALSAYVHPLLGPPIPMPPVFVNARKLFPVEKDLDPDEIHLSQTDFMDRIIDSEAKSIIIDIDCGLPRLREKMHDLQSYFNKPYIFRSDSYELLNFALFDYCGVCGFILKGNTEGQDMLMKKYGAIAI